MSITDIIAHGIGSRTTLPLPFWQLAWASIAALGFSFLGLGVLWKKPLLSGASDSPSQDAATSTDRTRRLGGGSVGLRSAVLMVARGLGLALFVLCIFAGLFGQDQALRNIAPVTIYVIFWVLIPFLSALLGDIWRAVSPFEAIASVVETIRPQTHRTAPDHHWFAALTIFMFLFLELAHPSGSSPRVLAWAMLTYTAITCVGLAVYGRSWLRTGEGFSVLFSLLAQISPIYVTESRRLGLRLPLAGLCRIDIKPGTVALILVALGGTSFDGLSESDDYIELVGNQTGWAGVSPTVLGLAATIAVAWGLYVAGSWFTANVTETNLSTAADTFAPALLPILWGYLLAHYALLLVDEVQRFIFLLSNPYGVVVDGEPAQDFFGTAGGTINFELVNLDVIAWVQTSAIVIGHIAGVMVAHDIGLAKYDRLRAMRSQYVMLFVMMIYSVGGLALLFNS